jgi:preprotein translocase subunit SecF
MALQIIKQRRLWWWISGTLLILSLIGMGVSWAKYGAPVNPGLDFVGGTRLQLERNCTQPTACAKPLEPGQIRQALAESDLERSNVQVIGKDQQGLVVSTPSLNPAQRLALQQKLDSLFGPFDPQKTQIDTVGPTLGRQILTSGLLALLVSFIGITIYLSFRFQRDYAVLGMVALVHDVFLTVGVFAWLGVLFGVQSDSLFVVALLTITGFSINDTVVIYDRIRETLKLNPQLNIDNVVDSAVNQTLGRSINTTLTTLLPLVSIYLFGGATLQTFALALIVGFVLGAYSSIFIASTLLAWWREHHPQPPTSRPLQEVQPGG